MKSKTIRIIHFHFDTSENLGDAAVVYAIRDLIKNNVAKYAYRSMSIKYLVKFRLQEELDHANKNNNTVHNTFKAWLALQGIKYKKMLIQILKKARGTDDKSIINLINSHDIVLIGGGGLYSKWTTPFNTEVLSKIRKPIAIIGAGYNQNLSDSSLGEEELSSIKYISSIARFISVRDLDTHNFLLDLGVKSTIIGDPAISLIKAGTDLIFSGKLKIGINIAYHNWSKQDEYTNSIINTYTKVLTTLSNKYDIEIYYLKHSVHEDYIVDKLIKKIPHLIICDCNARELKEVYANLDLAISMMLHSSILAFSVGTKFINIAYDKKNYSFMDLIGYSDNLISVSELDEDVLYKIVSKLIDKNSKNSYIVNPSYFINRQSAFIKKIFNSISSR